MLGEKRRKILNYLLDNNPASAWRISKNTPFSESLVRYHLDELVDKGILIKEKSKYSFVEEVFAKDGIVFILAGEKKYVMVCPHYGSECDCETKDCRFLKELNKEMELKEQ